MTPYELKAKLEASRSGSKFFTRNNMRFAGDTMRNYGVRGPVEVETWTGKATCWELYRKRPVKHGLKASAFFDCETFCKCWPRT